MTGHNPDVNIEKDEYAQQVEDELNPMNYTKVFANDKYLVFRPKLDEVTQPKQPFFEFFENKCYKAEQLKKE